MEEAQQEYDKNIQDNFYKLLPKYGDNQANVRAIKLADDCLQSKFINAQQYLEAYKRTEKQLANLYRKDICTALLRRFREFKSLTDAVSFIENFNTKYADFKFYKYSDKMIFKLSEEAAERCKSIAATTYVTSNVIDKMDAYACELHIAPATADDDNTNIIFDKYADSAWWLPRLRRVIRRKREELAFDCDLINPNFSKYSSKFGQRERKEQLERNKKWSEMTKLSDGKKSFLMSELIASQENSYQAELVTMLAGLRDMQDSKGWKAAMITNTCPSRMQKFKKIIIKDGQDYYIKNPRYDGVSTPADTITHLRTSWARIGAQSAREGELVPVFKDGEPVLYKRGKKKGRQKMEPKGLDIRMMQVWQPASDGTAHQHIYAIGSEEELNRFAEICKQYALEVDGHEKGAEVHRCDILHEDKEKGRLATYAARYVTRLAAKDGDEKSNASATMTAEDAWYAAYNVRRISWLGLPPKALWRAFNKAKADQFETEELNQLETEELKEIHLAAKGSERKDEEGKTILSKNGKPKLYANYAKFCELIGWNGSRKDLDYEVLTDSATNKYGETTKKKTGVRYCLNELVKEAKEWVSTTQAAQDVIKYWKKYELWLEEQKKSNSDASWEAFQAYISPTKSKPKSKDRRLPYNYPRADKSAVLPALSAEINAEIDALMLKLNIKVPIPV